MYLTFKNISNTINRNLFLILVLCFSFFPAHAQEIKLPEKPSKETSVYDEAKLLSIDQKDYLEQKLINYADSTSTQIVVATVESLEGANINLFAAEWAHKWGIGQADKDNGVLFLIAKDDRKMAIQVGYGLEHLLTDAMSRRIIELVVAPYFKQGDYFSGLDAGTTSMMQVLSGEYQNDEETSEGGSIPFVFIIIFFILIFIILSKANKNKGNNSGRGYTSKGIGPIIFGGGGSSGGFGSGGFGGGGGGFSGGFGGGGFGGGGASGGW